MLPDKEYPTEPFRQFPRNEWEMESDVIRRLRCNPEMMVGRQIPLGIGGRIADIVWVTVDGMINSVELKLANWGNALDQARDHQADADFSYICLPPKKRIPSAATFKALAECGIGYLEYIPPMVREIHIGHTVHTVTDDFSHPFIIRLHAKRNVVIENCMLRRNAVGDIEVAHQRRLGEAIRLVNTHNDPETCGRFPIKKWEDVNE